MLISGAILLLVLTFRVVAEDFFSFTEKDIAGFDVSFEDYRDKVTLVVNVATECQFTDSHYKGLMRLHHMFHKDVEGNEVFNVIGFPCNQFGNQEPGTNEQVLNWAERYYGVNFRLFSKVNVIEPDISPLWKYLAQKKVPNWNFWKYLVGPDGAVIDAWGPNTSVEDIVKPIQRSIETLPPRPKPEKKVATEQSEEKREVKTEETVTIEDKPPKKAESGQKGDDSVLSKDKKDEL